MASSSGRSSATSPKPASNSNTPALYTCKIVFVTLNHENYVSWKAQVSDVVRGADLLDYVEGKIDISTSTILARQDQIILGWLLAALAPLILPQATSLQSSAEVWKALGSLFSLNSATRILFLRWQRLMVKKGAMSMEVYIAHVRKNIDDLVAVGEKMDELQIVLTVLGGLGSEFSQFLIAMTTNFNHNLIFVDLQAILMDQEMSAAKVFDEMPIAANVAIASDKGESQTPVLTTLMAKDRVNFVGVKDTLGSIVTVGSMLRGFLQTTIANWW